MPICQQCHEYYVTSTHTCSPIYKWHNSSCHGEDEWEAVRARDPEEAAEKAADAYDAEERTMMMRGHGVEFTIRDPAGIVTVWCVRGEAEPRYYATEKKT